MPPEPTSAQKKAVREAVANLNQAYMAVRRARAAAGIKVPVDGDNACTAPPSGHCNAFKPPVRGFRCARARCGHPFGFHAV
jgi:hypothetical protein